MSKNTGSSSFFKRSTLTTTNTNTTITGKSSIIKRDGGIKLLDAQEQSASPKEAKRKRKELEKETQKKLKMEEKQLEKEKLKQSHRTSIEDKEKLAIEPTDKPMISDTNNTNIITSNNGDNGLNQPIEPITQAHVEIEPHQHQPQAKNESPHRQPQTIQQIFNSMNQNNDLHYQQQAQQISTLNDILTASSNQSNANPSFNPLPPSLPMFTTNINHNNYNMHSSPLQLPQINHNHHHLVPSNIINVPDFTPTKLEPIQQHQQTVYNIQSPMLGSNPTLLGLNGQNSQMNRAQQQQPQQQQSLSLTREQMLQAQEMFNSSNRLTRPEKALILGFIAGSRENPRPEHGSLVSIKLNESEEILTSSNGQQHRVLSELFFQMNYDTGEYKKIKKVKPIVMGAN